MSLNSPSSPTLSKRRWDDDYPWKYFCVHLKPPEDGYPPGALATDYRSLKEWCTSSNQGPACGCDQDDGEPTCGLDDADNDAWYDSPAARMCLIACMCIDVQESESAGDNTDNTISGPGTGAGGHDPMVIGGGASDDDDSDSDDSMGAPDNESTNHNHTRSCGGLIVGGNGSRDDSGSTERTAQARLLRHHCEDVLSGSSRNYRNQIHSSRLLSARGTGTVTLGPNGTSASIPAGSHAGSDVMDCSP